MVRQHIITEEFARKINYGLNGMVELDLAPYRLKSPNWFEEHPIVELLK
jgi:hypothetical protein